MAIVCVPRVGQASIIMRTVTLDKTVHTGVRDLETACNCVSTKGYKRVFGGLHTSLLPQVFPDLELAVLSIVIKLSCKLCSTCCTPLALYLPYLLTADNSGNARALTFASLFVIS